MPRNIQYATTSDGVAIAWCEEGAGPPLVTTTIPFGMVDGSPAVNRSWQGLTRSFRMISYDPRGAGLSDRSSVDFSMDAMQRDLDAVVDMTDEPAVVLAGSYDVVPVIVAYAAAHPERVSHLVLRDGWSRFSDQQQSASYNTMMLLMDADWMHASDIIGRVLMGIDDSQRALQLAEHIRTSISHDAFKASQLALADWGVEHLLSRIVAPTLVLHSRRNPWQPVAAGQRIAAGIRGAKFQVINDQDQEHLTRVIEEFVLGRSVGAERPGHASDTAIILFTDIADSTALTERMGDAAFREASRALDERCRDVIRGSGGTPVEGKVLGDGVMAVFASARQAIDAALRCQAATDGTALQLHAGVHAGDVIRDGDNVYGGAVNVAARIAGASAAGETLVSATVRDLARTSAGVAFEDRGERELKGVGESVRVFAVVKA